MVSLNTETDRTLFFDLLPMDIGVVGGFKTKLQLYTVPGQVFYNSTRKLVLKGVDGIVFVADSQTPMLDANKESLQNLDDNLRELGLDIRQIPMVFQWNKRDLKNVVPIEEMEAELNPRRQPSFQGIASDGTGVFETLRGITKLALAHIKAHHFADTGAEEAAPAPPTPPPPPPAPVDAPEVLTLSDLPSVGELLDDEPYVPPVAPAAASVPARPALPTVAPPRVAPAPKPAPAPLRPMLPSAAPARNLALPKPVAPRAISLAAPAAPKLKPLAPAAPLTSVSSILGDLTHVSGMGSSTSVLKLELPANLESHELEILVQVLQHGRLVAEGQSKKTPPGAGVTAKLTIELKKG
jgi:signal recognition particle receptor subunit beta